MPVDPMNSDISLEMLKFAGEFRKKEENLDGFRLKKEEK
jgi:hypothetical protein